MNVRRFIQKRIRHEGGGLNVVSDVNAAISANVNEPGPSRTHVSSRQRVVQRSSRTTDAKRDEAEGSKG